MTLALLHMRASIHILNPFVKFDALRLPLPPAYLFLKEMYSLKCVKIFFVKFFHFSVSVITYKEN